MWCFSGVNTWPLVIFIICEWLPNIYDILFTNMFADDTSMFINSYDLKAMATQLNSELKEVSIWLQVNKLYSNVEKSGFIHFKSVKKLDLEVDICINDTCLSRVSQVKFLGTIIDDKLTWQPHIDYISKKFSRAIAIMYRIKPSITQETLCGLCILIWLIVMWFGEIHFKHIWNLLFPYKEKLFDV